MIFHPSILALYISSLLIVAIMLYAASQSLRIVWRWNPASGSELQLRLERRTYLVSTLVAFMFGFQLLSFFLYIFTADRLHSFFAGAMCAAGTFAVNEYGYPALGLKVGIFFLAGGWLILNHVDNRAYDYPLIRKKYIFLLALAPFIILEEVAQIAFFLHLKPEIITSCCGSLFSSAPAGARWLRLPSAFRMIPLFFAMVAVATASALYFLRWKRGGGIFSVLSIVTSAVSITSFLSFISSYIYELPTHSCPFCVLQKEYHYIGYLLYTAVLGGGLAGAGVGMLMPFRKIISLVSIIPSVQRTLTLVSLLCILSFAVFTLYAIATSNLALEM